MTANNSSIDQARAAVEAMDKAVEAARRASAVGTPEFREAKYVVAQAKARAAEARIALVRSSGWQPISTAPRDGSAILACYAPHYESNGFLPVAVRWRTYHPNAKGEAAWRDSSGTKCNRLTHWMPLPSPPAPTDGREGE